MSAVERVKTMQAAASRFESTTEWELGLRSQRVRKRAMKRGALLRGHGERSSSGTLSWCVGWLGAQHGRRIVGEAHSRDQLAIDRDLNRRRLAATVAWRS